MPTSQSKNNKKKHVTDRKNQITTTMKIGGREEAFIVGDGSPVPLYHQTEKQQRAKKNTDHKKKSRRQ